MGTISQDVPAGATAAAVFPFESDSVATFSLVVTAPSATSNESQTIIRPQPRPRTSSILTASAASLGLPVTPPAPVPSPRDPSADPLFNAVTPAFGTVISKLGHTFTWSEQHPRLSALIQLRTEGDHDADEMVEKLKCKFNEDIVGLIAERGKRYQESFAGPTHPNNEEHAVDRLCYNFLEKYSTPPAWVDWKRVAAGQLVFQRYCLSGYFSLLSSLIGGFGAPLINKVLMSTNYLAGNCPETYRRLMETTAMVAACVGPDVTVLKSPWKQDTSTTASTPQFGHGFLAALRVRFLHTKVRKMLESRTGPSMKWDFLTYGVPINQEDLLATLLVFSFTVVYSLRRVGNRVSDEECDDYIHLWKYIGWIMGVKESTLDKWLLSYHTSQLAIEGIVVHLMQPDHTSKMMSEHIIRSASQCSFLGWTPQFYVFLVRSYLSDELADALQLPQNNLITRVKGKLFFAQLNFMSRATYWTPWLQQVISSWQLFAMNSAIRIYMSSSPSSLVRSKVNRDEASTKKFLAAACSDSSSLPPLEKVTDVLFQMNPDQHHALITNPVSTAELQEQANAKCPFFNPELATTKFAAPVPVTPVHKDHVTQARMLRRKFIKDWIAGHAKELILTFMACIMLSLLVLTLVLFLLGINPMVWLQSFTRSPSLQLYVLTTISPLYESTCDVSPLGVVTEMWHRTTQLFA